MNRFLCTILRLKWLPLILFTDGRKTNITPQKISTKSNVLRTTTALRTRRCVLRPNANVFHEKISTQLPCVHVSTNPTMSGRARDVTLFSFLLFVDVHSVTNRICTSTYVCTTILHRRKMLFRMVNQPSMYTYYFIQSTIRGSRIQTNIGNDHWSKVKVWLC